MCQFCKPTRGHKELLEILKQAEVIATLESVTEMLRSMKTKDMEATELAKWASSLAGVSVVINFLLNGNNEEE